MHVPERSALRERAKGRMLDGVDLLGTAAFGGGSVAGVAFGKFMLGGFLAVLAIGIFLRFKRRRRAG
jgi:hypothetical protein